MDTLMSSVPPILQVVILVGLGCYVALSIAARISQKLGARVWDADRSPDSTSHLIEYTIVPAVLFVAALVFVVQAWDHNQPWLGGWEASSVVVAGGLGATSIVAFMIAHVLSKKMDLSDARRLASWIPFMLFLIALASMIGAIFLIMRA